jgi:hypothetical protein
MQPNSNIPMPDDDAFTITDIKNWIGILWRSKKLIIAIAGTCAVLAMITASMLANYKSEGYFSFNVSLPNYRRLQAAMAAPGRWENFTKTLSVSDRADSQAFNLPFSNEKAMQAYIVPIYPITKSELKDLPDSASKDASTGISALKLSFKAKTPEKAQKGVLILAEFIRDTAILENYNEQLINSYTEFSSTQRKFQNKIIDANYRLEQTEIQKAAMQQILRAYPQSEKSDNRQLASLTVDSTRYLSPLVQLVAIETSIADLKQSIPKIKREQRFNDIYLSYNKKALALMNGNANGAAIINELPAVLESLKLDENDDLEKSAHNSLFLDNQAAKAAYFEKIRFVGEPTLSKNPTPSIVISGMAGLFLGLFFGIVYLIFARALTKEAESTTERRVTA